MIVSGAGGGTVASPLLFVPLGALAAEPFGCVARSASFQVKCPFTAEPAALIEKADSADLCWTGLLNTICTSSRGSAYWVPETGVTLSTLGRSVSNANE